LADRLPAAAFFAGAAAFLFIAGAADFAPAARFADALRRAGSFVGFFAGAARFFAAVAGRFASAPLA
jgi:hypothetical protein